MLFVHILETFFSLSGFEDLLFKKAVSQVFFYLLIQPGRGICSFDFQANHSFFAQKWANERFAK